jgi:hypothetical protein
VSITARPTTQPSRIAAGQNMVALRPSTSGNGIRRVVPSASHR